MATPYSLIKFILKYFQMGVSVVKVNITNMYASNETFSEILNVLISSNCPLISRTDHWWIEELLFKPGKPRTDLIVWIISKLTNSVYPSELDNDSTTTSSASNNFKIPENDEGDCYNECSTV